MGMMKFRTELQVEAAMQKISHKDEILLVGSCFSENLGALLSDHKFKAYSNPMGTLYDPISIFRMLQYALEPQRQQFHYIQREETWYAFETHSEIYDNDRNSLEHLLKEKLEVVRSQVLSSKFLFITLGSAWVYKLVEQDLIVANCHKQNASYFQKQLLSYEQIMLVFKDFYETLRIHHPQLEIVFTLSPVRHIKDGIENNHISKSLLRYCISRFQDKVGVSYFPSYELVMDDLRDYRFYKEDLIHPNESAVRYIWEKFSDTYFDKDTLILLHTWQKVKQSLNHKAHNPQSEAYQKHLRSTLEQLQNLSVQLDVIQEIQQLQSILN